ncbi:MAG TPA: PVC-type heme-binding CxxCH protein [Chthoniobacter sp.]|nr:PVC-type heme-binding CxxCH protein [Chthoniobacter sp.]
MKRLFLVPAFALFCGMLTHAEPVSLFDGKTMEGWESREPSLWKVEDGCLTGGDEKTKIPHNDFLCTKRSFSNFVLKLKIKLTGDPKTGMINSGVQIRTQRNPSGHEVCGYQCDYGEPSWYAGIYDEGRRNKFIAPADMNVLHPAIKLWDWNDYEIRAEGNRIRTWINGVPGVDYKEEDPNIPYDGILGVQVHAGGNTKVQLKDVFIEELPPTPDAPTWEKLGGVEGVKAKLQAGKKSAGKDSDARENAGAGVATKSTAGGRDISYNSVTSGPKTPDEERASLKVPEGFEVQLVAAEDVPTGIGKFVPLAFDQKGRLWTTTALEYPVDGNENAAAADATYAGHGKDKVLVFDRDPSSPTGYANKPRVFADGLAIPLGVLPYGDGCYVHHGHNIEFLHDTDGDGKADKTEVILTGFGVQDSHLMPHQFTRAPGGWIWMAQGAFNYGKVRRPSDPPDAGVQFDQCRMAKFRPDGSQFTITSQGPCNIWGLVINGEGEGFIQEANDYGYPVMPFHEFANYPGCSDKQMKSYAPEFPGTAPDFKMGGTGLSGLALTDKAGPYPEQWRDVMLVANPITNRINAIKLHRDGPRWKLEKLADLVVSEDPWFRPVAISIGPDGCLYIVDWYNKIISHNEVPRNHPDRDKTRGRIWRIKPTGAKPFDVADLTHATQDELIAKLGGESLPQSQLAWQSLVDRPQPDTEAKLRAVVADEKQTAEKRIQSLWAIEAEQKADDALLKPLLASANRNIRREAVRAWADEGTKSRVSFDRRLRELLPLVDDADPEVRAQVARAASFRLGWHLEFDALLQQGGKDVTGFQIEDVDVAFRILLALGRGPLAEPVAPSTKNNKPIKVREAYDREFERYLVRMSLERYPDKLAAFLDSDTAKSLPVENRLLALLALDPKTSAARVAELLPQLERSPGQEEILRLAQYSDEPGVREALVALLVKPVTRASTIDSLLAVRTRLDATKLNPLLTVAANNLLSESGAQELGVRLATSFGLGGTEPKLVYIVNDESKPASARGAALRALASFGSTLTELFAKTAQTATDPLVRDEALAALAASKATEGPARLLALYPQLTPAQRHVSLDRLSESKAGASAVVAALTSGAIPTSDLDGSTLDRLQAVLGSKDAALNKLVDSLGSLFRPVLMLDGSDNAWVETNQVFEGPMTVETWVRLSPQGRKIGNVDGILGAPGQLDLNFFDGKLRVYAFPPLNDVVVAKKPITPDLWTHVAAVRNADNRWSLYIDGEPDSVGTKDAPGTLKNPRIGWTAAKGGTQGAFAEYRLWNRARTPEEIRRDFDRGFGAQKPSGLVFYNTGGDNWGTLQNGAHVGKTSDLPPILTADEAVALDAKFAKYRALANQPGDVARGNEVAMLCRTCHLINGQGGAIGPNISGAGAMGQEALLRRLITPNASMESAYHIFRVNLRDGGIREGFLVRDDKDAVVLRLPGAEDQRIPRAEILDTKFLRRGMMPEGLLDAMAPQQVSDLVAYLMTLK